MLRKNWLLKIRHPFVTCAEILLPTVVMLLLIAVRMRVDTRLHPPQAYIRKDMLVEVGKGDKSAPFNQILELLCSKGEYLAFAPDTSETRMMINVLSIKFPLLKLAAKVYQDEEELETYIHSDLYGGYDEVKLDYCSQFPEGLNSFKPLIVELLAPFYYFPVFWRNCTNPKIKGAIVFHTQGPRLFDYSIRLNHTWAFSGFPNVNSIMDTNGPFLNDLELGVNIIPIMQYSFSGFLTMAWTLLLVHDSSIFDLDMTDMLPVFLLKLQQVMDSFIIFAAQQHMTNSDTEELVSSFDSTSLRTQLEIPWTQFSPSNIRLAPFPTREYTDDEFQSIVKSVMGVLYLLGFLYPISRLISYSVFEKEQKIKEGLYMMGLKDNMFILSWFLTYVLQFAVSSGIITLCTMGTLFKYSDKSLVFVYFFCFGLSSITLSFLISTFFTRAKTAVAVGTLAFLAAFFPYYSVDDEAVPTLFKVMASFLSPTAFALGSINFADYERAHVGLRWSNIWRDSSGVSFLVCFLMMLLDTFLYCAIGLYLDKVLHKEKGPRWTWSSMLFKPFWKKNNTSDQFSSSSLVKLIDSEFEENARFSGRDAYKPAVEAISLEMKQQELDGRCIQIRNLHKVYTSKKARCCAVNSLQLTLYENQILALLGHNGAGKSTTMSMLVGLVRPTSGDALVFGKNILTDMCWGQYFFISISLNPSQVRVIRSSAGLKEILMEKYCPQHYREQMECEFRDLKQEGMTIAEYGRKFNQCLINYYLKLLELEDPVKMCRITCLLSSIDEIRQSLGVCPQYDILFPELTVREHLEIFADIKGVNEDCMENVVTEMAEEFSPPIPLTSAPPGDHPSPIPLTGDGAREPHTPDLFSGHAHAQARGPPEFFPADGSLLGFLQGLWPRFGVYRGGARGGFRGGSRRGSRGGNRDGSRGGSTSRGSTSRGSRTSESDEVECFYCHEYGHTKYNCPQLAAKNQKSSSAHVASSSDMVMISSEEYAETFIEIANLNHLLPFLLTQLPKAPRPPITQVYTRRQQPAPTVEVDSCPLPAALVEDHVGLADKLNTFVRALSGGMRRKLSLGIALIGNSKVIILDEPTSGMDPYSMRLTWQLIKRLKKGRIILLTTHSMDEADALGDRIAIMASGSLKCCGSSFFLKQHYGVGYTLTLVKTTPTASAAADIVYSHIPSATCVGNEISFKLPLASSSSFESMFREIESCMHRSRPSFDTPDFRDNIFLGIESYGISVTTLEEVFLRVAGGDFDETERLVDERPLNTPNLDVNQPNQNNHSGRIFHSKVCKAYIEVIGFIFNLMGKASSLFLETTLHVIKFLSMQCCCSCIISRSTFWRHSKALLIKRAVSARRDRKTIIFQLLIPAVFLLLGLLMIQLKPHPDQQSVTFTTSHFNPLLTGGGGGGPIPFDLSLLIAKEVSEHVHGGWIQRFRQTTYKFPDSMKALDDAVEAAGPTLGPILLSMSEYLMSSYNETYQSRYGAVVMDKQSEDGSLGYTILHNSSCQHAAPTFINLINSAILRLATLNENMTIQTRNHPLPMTKSQLQQRHDLDAFKVAVVVTIAFSFVPASFAVAIVKEREVKAKHQQLISGVSVLSYWASTYFWDFISFLFPSSIAIFLFCIFGLDQFIGRDSLFSTVLMFLGYGLSIASSTYCLTFFFSEHSMAQNVVLLIHFFTGLILMAISFIMGIIESTRQANSLLKLGSMRNGNESIHLNYGTIVQNFFRLSPGFCFADGLASLALLRQGMKKGSGDSVFDWNVTGASICYLAAEGMIYFVLTLGLEFLLPHKISFAMAANFWMRKSKKNYAPSSSSLDPLLKTSLGDNGDLEEDIDVHAERNRVLSGGVGSAIVYLHNLRKVYPGGKQHGSKTAVHSLTFSVQEGECFGFLGTNGAGKTTTLSMLSGKTVLLNFYCLYVLSRRSLRRIPEDICFDIVNPFKWHS
ncbi:hypothetical protein DH2020_016664 [Rehmannia glutinosa]|uniref:Uncharacterized protein n=1 Tax=Rehmannia glutinosa TaxID=99300 RepID=A0ABR0WPS9_REHGL